MKILALLALGLFSFGLTASAIVELDSGRTKYIAAVVQAEEGIEVWINLRAHWEERGSLVDTYSEEEQLEVDQITEKTNLCNLAESQYEPCRAGRSVDQIRNGLENAGVEIDSAFNAWAQEEISGR